VLALVAVSLSLAVNLARGSTKEPSLLGIKRCSENDCALFSGYIGLSGVLTYIAARIVYAEQALKFRTGRLQSDSDVRIN
jgi:hypothetical protein